MDAEAAGATNTSGKAMMLEQWQALRAQLIRHEGVKPLPYPDTEGHLTIGVGHNLEDGLPQPIIDALLDYDMGLAIDDMRKFDWFNNLDVIRQQVLLNMRFNLGMTKLLGFHVTLAAVQAGDYEAAALHMLDSKWATQVKGRAIELAQMMRTGHATIRVEVV